MPESKKSMSQVLSKDMFDGMLTAMDANGDGSVDKEEFRAAYCGAFASRGTVITEAEYDKVWAKVDIDGSNDVSVTELSKFFGFDAGTGNSEEMSEDQILAALQMQSHLFDEVMKSFSELNVAPGGGGKRRASVLAAKMPKPISQRQKRQFLGIKSVRIPQTIGNSDAGLAPDVKLLVACETGDMEALKALTLTRELLFVEDDQKGETPIVKLARHGLTGLIRDLIQLVEQSSIEDAAKHYVNLQDKKGRTGLFYAAEYGHSQLVDMFLVRNSDPMAVDGIGRTVLHTAVAAAKSAADAKLVELILSHERVAGVKSKLIHMSDDQGRMAIHIASYGALEAVVQTLLSHGADPQFKDVHGNDSIKLASRSGRKKSKEILEEYIKKKEGGS